MLWRRSAHRLRFAIPRVQAADVTYERLLNPEPQNWLTNHHDFGAHRYSALDIINKSNVKNLKLAFAIAIGGTSGNENLEATPLVEDGFMYMTDAWGVVYKIDVRSGTSGRVIWKMDPGQEKIDRNRGVALWGNLVISVVGGDARVIATDKETGKIVWDKNLDDQRDLTLNAAPLALKDAIIVGASGGDQGVRDWLAALDPATGELKWRTYRGPQTRRARQRNLEGQSQRLADRRRRLLRHRLLRSGQQSHLLGCRQSVAEIQFIVPPRRQSLYRQRARHRRRNRQDRVVSPIHAERHDGLRRDRHAHRHRCRGQRHHAQNPRSRGPQRLLLHFRSRQRPIPQGHPIRADGDVDQRHRPGNRQAGRLRSGKRPADLCAAGRQNRRRRKSSGVCPAVPGGSNFWPAAYSEKTKLLYIPEVEGCSWISRDQTRHVPGKFEGGNFGYDGRLASGLVVVDPATGEVKQRKAMPYADTSGALATAGGIVVTALIDGTVMALDDQTLDELWSINVGTGINAPPMTYAVNGKQYIAIATGLTADQKGRVAPRPS